MKVKQIKQQLDFFADALFQTGYDMGWNSVLEEFEQLSDHEWNNGQPARAEALRWAINKIKGEINEFTQG